MKKKIFLAITIIELLLSGSLKCYAKSIQMSANKSYTKLQGKISITVLEGSAKIEIEGLEISADQIELSGKDYRYMNATGTIKGKDNKKEIEFLSDNLEYDRISERVEFFGKSKIIDKKNNAEVSAQHIIYNQKNDTVLLQIDVEITQKNIHTSSMFAFYRRAKSTLDLTGHPRVKKNDDEFSARRIFVNLATEEINLEGKVSGSVIQAESQKEKDKITEDDPKENTTSNNKNTSNDSIEKKSAEQGKPKD